MPPCGDPWATRPPTTDGSVQMAGPTAATASPLTRLRNATHLDAHHQGPMAQLQAPEPSLYRFDDSNRKILPTVEVVELD